MASYRQYRSASNYRERQKARNADASLDYSDPFVRYNLKDVPGVGPAMRASDQKKYYDDYLRNYGMTWKDVKYPALLGGVSPLGAGISAGHTVLSMRVLRNMYR